MSDTARHYSRLASDYDRLWSPDEHFIDDTAAAIVAALDLRPEDRLVDLGGGTGLYAAAMAARAGLATPPLVVDPSTALLEQAPAGAVRTRADDALAFARSPEPFDKLLIKEMVHHLEPAERAAMLAELPAGLPVEGRLLVVLLPPTIDHPLFRAALERFEAAQPHHDDIAAELRHGGLSVEISFVDRPLVVARDRYVDMLRGRYMSLLSGFDDAELEAGIAEVLAAHPEPELRFTYRQAFVLGERPPS